VLNCLWIYKEKHVLKGIVLEKQRYMVLSIKHWAGKDLRAGILFGIVCKDQWACIPYGIGIMINGLTSLMTKD
jgi:hypothetical protein